MTTQKPNNKNPEYNQQEQERILADLKRRVYSEVDTIKKMINEDSNQFHSVNNLLVIKEAYTKILVPSVKEYLMRNNLLRLYLEPTTKEMYNLINGMYQHAFRHAESIGVKPSDLPPQIFPKSLEKITFPQDN